MPHANISLAVMFQISQIGNDQGADNFLKTLMADESALNEVLRATAGECIRSQIPSLLSGYLTASREIR